MTHTPSDMSTTARELVAIDKGLLAADESAPTIEKRFRSVDVDSTEENRRAYREMLFTTPGLEAHISGVILFDETIRQASSNGVPFPDLLWARGIIPGIKVDKGTRALPGLPGEKMTQGLDGLAERLTEYYELGARFTKWRAVFSIGPRTPTSACVRTNATDLARFASLSQDARLVPIVEPEVLMDGSHTIERSYEVTSDVIAAVFSELHAHGVRLEETLLKVNMVLAGYDCPEQVAAQQVAAWTIRCLNRHLPPAIPGVVFLSGGQSEEMATVNLDAINRTGPHPWELSFSYGRALQTTALRTWALDPANTQAAQEALQRRAAETAAARSGTRLPVSSGA